VLSRKVLYHLSQAPALFCFIFWIRSLKFLFPWAGLSCDLLTYTSHIAGITEAYYHARPSGWDGVSLTVLPRLLLDLNPPCLCLPSSWASKPPVEDFCISVHKRYWSIVVHLVFCLLMPLGGFGIRVIWPHVTRLAFLRSLRVVVHSSAFSRGNRWSGLAMGFFFLEVVQLMT
jgi:hypothetical protein